VRGMSAEQQLPNLRMTICGAADVPGYSGAEVTHILSIDRPSRPTPTPAWFKGVHRHVVFCDVDSRQEASSSNFPGPNAKHIRTILDLQRAITVLRIEDAKWRIRELDGRVRNVGNMA
jgi:hypothetical protein